MIDYGILIILVHNAYLTPKGKPMPKIQPEKKPESILFCIDFVAWAVNQQPK